MRRDGLWDPVTQEAEQAWCRRRAIYFYRARIALFETLILACDYSEITVPATEALAVFRQEVECFGYVLAGSSVKYAFPPGFHDHRVVSLRLSGAQIAEWRDWDAYVTLSDRLYKK